ncbi:hypothetical protein [Roseobacter sp. OBYS 0001]|uniref:hypothetical protein n=1 Tax=Roseobacter sp. OBYS 0001 TaxID=882651 RepID=UPI001BC32ABC|nr:hypothetical protein [Roseobacter sp. OBYS 0001]GIT86165.1 hypothetical protein ROBYS_11810 [Roseobacter sp. OBYS 0001]
MSDLVFRKDGSVVLPSNADPASHGCQVVGWCRHAVGMDLGRNDPSAIVAIRDECYPEFTGSGFQQQLGERRRTVVFQETVQLYSYTDLADYLVHRLQQIPNWQLTIDASGLGAPFSSTLDLAGIEHNAVVMTAGASLSREGRKITCSKSLLIENMAVGLETGALTVASDLDGKQDLLNEIASFELTSTSAGNLVLAGGGKGHHADRGIALALAYLSTTHLSTRQVLVSTLKNWS